MVRILIESGIAAHVISTHTNPELKEASLYRGAEKPKPFSLEHILAAIVVLSAGIILSGMVLAIELFIGKEKNTC